MRLRDIQLLLRIYIYTARLSASALHRAQSAMHGNGTSSHAELANRPSALHVLIRENYGTGKRRLGSRTNEPACEK